MGDVTPVAAVCKEKAVCLVMSDVVAEKKLLLIIRFGWINCMVLLLFLFAFGVFEYGADYQNRIYLRE